MIYESRSSQETFELGRRMGEVARPGEVYALSGNLGSGKTVFAQGFARGLGIEEAVTSPTFTLLRLYKGGRLPLCHMDAYRLEQEDELLAVGGHEYFGGPGVCLVEWPEQVEGLLPPDARWLFWTRDPARGPEYRRIRMEEEGQK